MKCPQCQNEVEMLKDTTSGVMCRECHELAKAATSPGHMTQMEILKLVGATRPDYFFGPGKGGVVCEPHQATAKQMRFHGGTLPTRQMKVYWMKPSPNNQFELLHADSFSCS